MKPMILLQTDFSLTWGAVASMKGVIKRVDPTLELHDLCHDIKSFDPWEASLSLRAVEPYWPSGTVIVSVVDPGVGTSRRAAAALLMDGTYVITPDNGTLTHLKHTVGIREIRELDETVCRYRGGEEVSVFHGRDLFGHAAALLASGKRSFGELGTPYPVEEVVECEEYAMEPVVLPGGVETWVLTGFPHYGGIEFNVENALWERLGYREGMRFRCAISREGRTVFDEAVPFAASFGFVEKGMPVLYRGSSGYLSLDVNCGHFMNQYGVGFGKDWKVLLSPEGELEK